jgi:hypothetical protein
MSTLNDKFQLPTVGDWKVNRNPPESCAHTCAVHCGYTPEREMGRLVESLWGLVEKWGEIWRPVKICGEMWGVQVESCGDLWSPVETTRGVFVGICGEM